MPVDCGGVGVIEGTHTPFKEAEIFFSQGGSSEFFLRATRGEFCSFEGGAF